MFNRPKSRQLQGFALFIGGCISLSYAFSTRAEVSSLDLGSFDGKRITLEGFVAGLPRGILENPLLFRHTRSRAIIATPQFPRVGLFSPDASLILAYQGTPEGDRGNIIEATEYNRVTHRFTPAELVFSKTGGPIQVNHNPRECYACHANDPEKQVFRPIWDSYPFWPDIYGSLKIGTVVKYENPKGRELKELEAWHSATKSKSPGMERYFSLPVSSLDSYEWYIDDFLAKKATVFNDALMKLNIDRIVHEIELSTRPFAAEAMVLLASADHWRGEVMARSLGLSPSVWYRDLAGVREQCAQSFRDKIRRQKEYGGRFLPQADDELFTPIAYLRMVAESALGLSMRNWALSLATPQGLVSNFDFGDRSSFIQPFEQALRLRAKQLGVNDSEDRGQIQQAVEMIKKRGIRGVAQPDGGCRLAVEPQPTQVK